MSTNLALDDTLIDAAKTLGQHPTKREAVTIALEQYIQRLKQRDVINAFASIDYDKKYNYKRHRKAT